MLPEAKAKKMKKKASEELRFGVISNTLRKAVFTLYSKGIIIVWLMNF